MPHMLSGPSLVPGVAGDQEVVDLPSPVAPRPDLVVAERLGDPEEALLLDLGPPAERGDVVERRLVAELRDGLDRLVAPQPAVSDLDREIVPDAREPELVPLQPVVDRD